ncbi:hypothetical protein ABZ725_51600 [Streptomyces sp. NPDC006872]|uniref:hypothetical protein n=1 Tax=Streptomyces sp. NPDC006872 TaxID=3155720 RepID=UPI0033E9ABA6
MTGQQPAVPEPTVQPTRYEVSLLPGEDINQHLYVIEVEYRGAGRWAVVHHNYCLGTDGDWDFGVKEYDRGDGWHAAHRFDLDTALALAKEHAPDVTVNGITAADAYRRAVPAMPGAADSERTAEQHAEISGPVPEPAARIRQLESLLREILTDVFHGMRSCDNTGPIEHYWARILDYEHAKMMAILDGTARLPEDEQGSGV